jgi:hypothetical protein
MPSLRKRAADKANAAAAGSPTPAGQEPAPPDARARPGARERAAMRRRIRKAARVREALVRELGALVLEMERLHRRNDELVARKAREIESLDRELSGLAEALGRRQTLPSVIATGVAGACRACGTLLGTEDRYCSRCGKPAGDGGAAAAAAPADDASAGAPSPAQLRLEPAGAERA